MSAELGRRKRVLPEFGAPFGVDTGTSGRIE
jgi:hypothetical protein